MQETFDWRVGNSATLLGLVLALLLGLAFLGAQSSNVPLERIGLDPGYLGYNLAAAKKHFSRQGYKLLIDAYRKAPDRNYVAQTEDTARIIVSPRFLGEIEMLPETVLSHRASIMVRHMGQYTGMGIVSQSHLHSDICRVHLRRNLPKLLPGMATHADEAIPEFLAKVNAEGFTPVPAMGFSFFIITQIFSYVFVGEHLARRQEWMQAISEYPKLMMSLTTTLRAMPAWTRPIAARLMKEKKSLTDYQNKLLHLFGPELETRRRDKKHLDALQWLVDSAAPHEADDRSILLKVMFLSAAAIFTSAAAIDHVLLDLCAQPEYIQPLRAEVSHALASTDGVWNAETLAKLDKLDSFMQESRRWNHPAALSIHRLALKDVTLSDGTLIPKGWVISMYAEALQSDAKYYRDPQVFDGNRFLPHMPKAGENGFAQILPGNLSWGHGRSTCPGRWYADAQIKLVLAKVLLNYDFRFPAGVEERPANVHTDERILPDPKAIIEMRTLS